MYFCASPGYGSHPAGRGVVEAREHQPEESIQESRERELRHRHREGQGDFRRLATPGATEDGEFQGLGTAVTLGRPFPFRVVVFPGWVVAFAVFQDSLFTSGRMREEGAMGRGLRMMARMQTPVKGVREYGSGLVRPIVLGFGDWLIASVPGMQLARIPQKCFREIVLWGQNILHGVYVLMVLAHLPATLVLFCFVFIRSFALLLLCTLLKVMRLTVVNVGGLDIIDGNHKLILAIMWQLMRRHTLNLLQVRRRIRFLPFVLVFYRRALFFSLF